MREYREKGIPKRIACGLPPVDIADRFARLRFVDHFSIGAVRVAGVNTIGDRVASVGIDLLRIAREGNPLVVGTVRIRGNRLTLFRLRNRASIAGCDIVNEETQCRCPRLLAVLLQENFSPIRRQAVRVVRRFGCVRWLPRLGRERGRTIFSIGIRLREHRFIVVADIDQHVTRGNRNGIVLHRFEIERPRFRRSALAGFGICRFFQVDFSAIYFRRIAIQDPFHVRLSVEEFFRFRRVFE